MNGYVLKPEVVERNRGRLKTKKEFFKLAILSKLDFHVTTLYYQVNLVVVEDDGDSFVIKNHTGGETDSYLIPKSERENYYIKRWLADTLIIKRRKNYFKFNQVSSLFNVLIGTFL